MIAQEAIKTELAAARSGFYKLLSIGFSRPGEDLYQSISSGEFEQAVRRGIVDIPWEQWRGQAPAAIAEDLGGPLDSYQDFESQYIGTFEVGTPKVPCPLCEGSYRSGGHRGEVVLEVLTFYKAFALAISEEFKDLHDHIVAELEFMHFLTFKEGQARREGSDPDSYLRAQRDFLEKHLGTMFPGLRDSAERVLNGGFFLGLIRLTELFVASDRAYLSRLLGGEIG